MLLIPGLQEQSTDFKEHSLSAWFRNNELSFVSWIEQTKMTLPLASFF